MAEEKMNFHVTWAMAVGGMVGGGIFSVLGVVVETAGRWAWLSFLIAGITALISTHSYSKLSIRYSEGGGAFIFLRKIDHTGFAGSLSWILILGYILTLSVYASTFGHYVAYAFNLGDWFPRLLALVIIGFLAMTNLRGMSNSSKIEIFTLYGKILVLTGLAVFGILQWDPGQLSRGLEGKSWDMAIIGAGTIFMAYEGFQLLSYDYGDLRNPHTVLPRATGWAVVTVILIYVSVALGVTMAVGADELVQHKTVALAIAGREILGTAGLIIVTVAAAFSTASVINTTLFSSSRLMEKVAEKKDLPHLFVKENRHQIPKYAIWSIVGVASFLAGAGNLSNLVDAASIVFLFIFGNVNWIAFRQKVERRWLSLLGALFCGSTIIVDIIVKIDEKPFTIISLISISLLLFVIRPVLIRRMYGKGSS